MKVMLLAPQPFFQERGTPIAVNLVLKVLSEQGHRIDVLTYHEGETVSHEGVTISRTLAIPFIKGIRPGLSWKKLVCDGLMLIKAFRMAFEGRYQLVHAVEEGVFIALALKWVLKIPYIYDMDSSLRQQMTEKSRMLTPFAFPLAFFEKLAVKNATAVVPVCDALAESIIKHQPKRVLILRDVSLLDQGEQKSHPDLRAALDLEGPLMMYIGNLESYQGIDLMLESFALALEKQDSVDLVIIGGNPGHIRRYEKKCRDLGIEKKVHFLGPKPVEDMAAYVSQSDVLMSPRIKGGNTPMKVYSYLHSGKAVLATNLPTHTQVLSSDTAMLADPAPEAFSGAMLSLIRDEALRARLGTAGKKLVEERYSFPVFREQLNGLYAWLSATSGEATRV